MGVSMTIGEWVQAAGLRNGTVPVVDCVPGPQVDGVPLHDETNSFSRTYGYWTDFCEKTGLSAMFYHKETGFFRRHPRIARLDAHHAVQLRAALQRYMAKNGGVVADVEDDDVLADLHWLLHWFEWALANCKVPAIANA